MECNLCDLEQMPRNRLIIEAVACQLKSEYMESEIVKKNEELKNVHEEMKFREILSEKKDAELNKLKLRVELQSSELDKRKSTLKTKLLAVIVSLLSGVASVMVNVASNFLTSTSSNPVGNTILGIAAFIYLICTVMTIFILGGTS